MSEYLELNKIIKKGKKIEQPNNLKEYIYKYFSTIYNEDIKRELYFVCLYYGLIGKALTLENIGKNQKAPLTRERVRQIIDGVINKTKNIPIDFEHPFEIAKKEFSKFIENKDFIRIEELTNNNFFKDFENNSKGLIAFFNDCEVKQIAYRKQYYFYNKNLDRENVILSIQKENKNLRRLNTVNNMSKKAKTVTYVPNEIRTYLLDYSLKKKINLNPLYEQIINKFIEDKPYLNNQFLFAKTKSWKARKGKAEWQQIGIYIDKNIFIKVKECVIDIKRNLNKSVSLMSFICQAFIWHCELNNKN